MKVPRAFLSFGLLAIAIGVVAYGLSDAVNGLELGLLLPLALIGMALGWGLGWFGAPDWFSGGFSLFLGLEILIVRVGGLGGAALQVPLTILRVCGQAAVWVLMVLLRRDPTVFPEWGAIWEAFAALMAGVGILAARVLEFIVALNRGVGGRAYDPVAIALLWGFALWCCAVWAGWAFRRRRWIFPAILPAGILLATVLSFVRAGAFVLLPLLGATLLLMALGGHEMREHHWLQVGTDFSRDIRIDLWVAAVLVTAGLLVAAAVIPSISVKEIADWVQEVTREQSKDTERVAEALGLERRPEELPGPTDRARSGGLPQRHLIGSGPELSRMVVMWVRTGELPAMPEEMLTQPVPRYYWRSMTYDFYTGRGWTSSRMEIKSYPAGEILVSTPLPHQRRVRQEVQIVGEPSGLLHTAGMLVTTDQEFKVDWRLPQDSFGVLLDPEIVHYRADSLVTNATEEELRAAGIEYPQWVLNYYLQLPETIPDRVIALARDLTATEPTPYDRARAIEKYLRTTYPYTLKVPYPPTNRDVADYFLFDLKQGYCDYYATTMVVLARAAGLPARLVIGYANGTYFPEEARYVITEADAHAWVEVYFPTYGWVEFEPTGSQPLVDRTAEAQPIEWPEPVEPLEPLVPVHPEETSRGWFGWSWILGGLGALVLLAGSLLLIDGWRLSRKSPAAALGILYERLRRHGRRLHVTQQDGDTPHEFSRSFDRRIGELVDEVQWPDRLFPAAWEIAQLVALYERASYAPEPPDSAAVWAAIRIWWRLQLRLWLARLRWRRRPVLAPAGGAGPSRPDGTLPGPPPSAPA